MATAANPQDEEYYESEADEDFNPDVAAKQKEEESSSSDEEGEDGKQGQKKKRKEPDQDPGFENSGDEATISKARKKRRKQPDDEDEAGEGGLVKTRAQRKAEGKEKKPIANADASSVDVNALWAQISSGSAQKPAEPTAPNSTTTLQSANVEEQGAQHRQDRNLNGVTAKSAEAPAPSEAMVTIKRTYEFAGQKMEEEKSVPASSAEAKLYLEEQARQKAKPPPKPGMRRPMKRASMFDAAPTTAPAKGTKLNTVEKSKLDWATHVDQEGMADELDESRRAKGGYLGRMDFLSRMDAKREEDMQGKK